jgi:serine/threonine protein kinase
MQEVIALRRPFHPNIVPLLASYTEHAMESSFATKSLNMLFPWAEIDMERWLYLQKAPTFQACQTRSEQRQYLYNALTELVSALAALHGEVEGLVTSHHDLKPRNILIIGEKLMIADLGMSEQIHPAAAGGSEVNGMNGRGTMTYNPPEYYKEEDGERNRMRTFGRAFDMWAMGCIVIQVLVLVAWGWESRKVERFRKDREEFVSQQADRRRRNKSSNDDSFFKSIPVINIWLAQLQKDGSATLQGFIAVTIQMLREDPLERIYSWEAELDLYELLYPDESVAARFKKEEALVQGPPPGKDIDGVETPIHRSARRGKVTRSINMLQVGWPVEKKDGMGCTPIMLAEQSGHFQLRDILLQASKIKQFGWKSVLTDGIPTPIIHARERSGFRMRHETPEQDVGTHHYQSGQLDLHASLEKSASQERTQTLELDQVWRCNKFHEAAQRVDLPSLRSLLQDSSANQEVLQRDGSGRTPLHYAAAKSAEAVSMILKAITDVKVMLMAKDKGGRTPFHIAAKAGNSEVMEVLLGFCRHKIDVRGMLLDEDFGGMTPVKLAWENSQDHVNKLLDRALG